MFFSLSGAVNLLRHICVIWKGHDVMCRAEDATTIVAVPQLCTEAPAYVTCSSLQKGALT